MKKVEGTLNAKLRDPKYRKRFQKQYGEFKDILDSWSRLVIAGDDLVSAIQKYGGKWYGPSCHMREAIEKWIELCGQEVTRLPPVEPRDLPSKK